LLVILSEALTSSSFLILSEALTSSLVVILSEAQGSAAIERESKDPCTFPA
jgi:hypothetical protein